MQYVPELFLFGAEVFEVFFVRNDLEGNALRDAEAVAFDTRSFAGIVRDHAHLLDPEVAQDLRSDPVIPKVGRKPESLVRLDSVEALEGGKSLGFERVLHLSRV